MSKIAYVDYIAAGFVVVLLILFYLLLLFYILPSSQPNDQQQTHTGSSRSHLWRRDGRRGPNTGTPKASKARVGGTSRLPGIYLSTLTTAQVNDNSNTVSDRMSKKTLQASPQSALTPDPTTHESRSTLHDTGARSFLDLYAAAMFRKSPSQGQDDEYWVDRWRRKARQPITCDGLGGGSRGTGEVDKEGIAIVRMEHFMSLWGNAKIK